MKDLIAALTILMGYLDDDNNRCPTHCEHDILIVQYVDPEKVSDEDKEKLDKLGFFVCYEFDPRGCYASYRFGSG